MNRLLLGCNQIADERIYQSNLGPVTKSLLIIKSVTERCISSMSHMSAAMVSATGHMRNYEKLRSHISIVHTESMPGVFSSAICSGAPPFDHSCGREGGSFACTAGRLDAPSMHIMKQT